MKRVLLFTFCLLVSSFSKTQTPSSGQNPFVEVFLFGCIVATASLVVSEGFPRAIDYVKKLHNPTKKNAPDHWAGPLPQELNHILDLHKHYALFQKFNLTPARGYLLYGPPGTGKTLLPEVLARKLCIPLIRESSGNFFTMWQGSGTLRLSELIQKAHTFPQPKKGYFKCIVFIDEIDGITSRAESYNREETRLAEHLLTIIAAPENRHILFIGATNLFNLIDKALVRPGRLTPIYVGHPDIETRQALFRHYFKKHKVTIREASTITRLAEKTAGFSCAAIQHAIEKGLYMHLTYPDIPFTSCLEDAITQEQSHPLFDPACLSQ